TVSIVDQVDESRQRPTLLPTVPHYSQAEKPWGVWLAMDDEDHIFFEEQTSRLHQEHIILHEIGHMLGGHRVLEPKESLDARELSPDLQPKLVRSLLGRVRYDDRQDEEAAMLASLILASAGRGATRTPGPPGRLRA